MRLIESKAEYIPQEEGLEGIYKQIELCGRTCYKSEDKITEDSAKSFVERMIASKHTAMLEHGTVYLRLGNKAYNAPFDTEYYGIVQKYERNKYSKIVAVPTFVCKNDVGNDVYTNTYYITTNLRVLAENDWLEDLKYICEPTEYHDKRYTMKFITDRGVSHELVRHRVFSFAQESTRYCNYSKDKFGNRLTFIIPSWSVSIKPNVLEYSPFEITPKEAEFMQSCFDSEKRYLSMLKSDATPQEARQVLTNAIKTEICMTGFASDWRFFFDLRYYGETGKPHPDMELLASKARSEFMAHGIWDDIMKCPSKFD